MNGILPKLDSKEIIKNWARFQKCHIIQVRETTG